MKVLICTPYDLAAPCGNSIASARLLAGFEHHGHEVCLLDNCSNIRQAAVRSEVTRFGPDAVLIMHGWRCREAFSCIHSLNISPIVVSLRGTDVNEMLTDGRKASTITSILDRADGITVFNTGMYRSVLERLPVSFEKVHVIPNGLSIPPPDGDYRGKLGLPEEAPVIVGLAGIRPVKGTLLLLGRIIKLKKHLPGLRYIHAGPIIDKKEGELFIETCRNNPWITYVGEIPREEVTSFLQAGTTFASASFSEGMPHSVREAMLAGVPCLLSSIDGHRNMASDGEEALFFNDEPSFIDAALLLLGNNNLRERLILLARERVLADCRNNDEIGSYLRLFAGLSRT